MDTASAFHAEVPQATPQVKYFPKVPTCIKSSWRSVYCEWAGLWCSCSMCAHAAKRFTLGVVHKGHMQKVPVFLPLLSAFLSLFTSLPLLTSASSIRHCSMVWKCNGWCSQNMLLTDLFITTCNSKEWQNQQRVHVNNLTLGARPM